MHTEVSIDVGILWSFLIVLARVSGFVVVAPVPGLKAAPGAARIVLSAALSISLLPLWPKVQTEPAFADLALWVAAEFGLGLVTGIGLAMLLEAFQIGAQTIGLQAGFSYASTVDPSTQADTAVLQTVVQLFSGALVFTCGLDAHLLRLLSPGLSAAPNAAAISKAFNPEAVMRIGTLMFNTGLRLAMPVIGSLVLVDLAFALVSKVHAQLQLLSFSFALKMLAGVAVYAATLAAYPRLLTDAAGKVFEMLSRLLN